jgi:RNA recognition motif-containing protein
MDNKASSSSKTRNTVYVAGLADEVNEQQLLDAFVTFGTSSPSLPIVLMNQAT